MSRFRLLALLAVAVVGNSFAVPASAGFVSTTDRGRYNARGLHTASNENYLAGRQSVDSRNFFTFDLSNVSTTDLITSAMFNVFNSPVVLANLGGYNSVDPSETFELFDVTTPIGTLTANHPAGPGNTPNAEGVGIFNDLGTLGGGMSGSLGAQTVSIMDNGQFVQVALNPLGLTLLNAARGGQFALGGALTSLNGNGTQTAFNFSSSSNTADPRGNTFLTFETAAVPEPGSMILFGGMAGVAGLVGRARRRRKGETV